MVLYVSVATHGHPPSIKKKEASPDECDQAVEGLSTAKAKAKAKQVQESTKASQSVMQKF
jgi:LETM1 and EF-hand domain-containing protein 1, mitochondrial